MRGGHALLVERLRKTLRTFVRGGLAGFRPRPHGNLQHSMVVNVNGGPNADMFNEPYGKHVCEDIVPS